MGTQCVVPIAFGGFYGDKILLENCVYNRISGYHFILAQGDTSAATGWLKENLQQHGGLRKPVDTITHATGGAVSAGPLLDYLELKFSEIYRL